jgi:hypothetical protein
VRIWEYTSRSITDSRLRLGYHGGAHRGSVSTPHGKHIYFKMTGKKKRQKFMRAECKKNPYPSLPLLYPRNDDAAPFSTRFVRVETHSSKLSTSFLRGEEGF